MEKRLQSLKLPRDLTLGGTKPKKKFIPNFNVARNKELDKTIVVKPEGKRPTKIKKDYKNGKKILQNLDRFVQSSGIFSNGICAEDVVKQDPHERLMSDTKAPITTNNNNNNNGCLKISKINKDKFTHQVDSINDLKVYDKIMFYDSPNDEDEKLFSPLSWDRNNFTRESKVKFEQKVPQPFDGINCTDYNPNLSLWKLPHTLPGKGLSRDDPDKFFDYKLNEMSTGQIGKLKLYKSGKVEIIIGNIHYEIVDSKLQSFSEKIITMNNSLNENEDSNNDAVVLDEIQQKYSLIPDWIKLIEKD